MGAVGYLGYLRVSSKAQDSAMQRASIERAADARGDAIHTWYSEKRSGKTIARPELELVHADARAGKVKRLGGDDRLPLVSPR